MAGPVASKIILPLDTGNTGKNVRTQSKLVGSDTVHEHFFVPGRQALVLGTYRLTMAQIVALASAQNGTSSAALWFHVPSAISNKKARLRELRYSSQHATALATPTAPRLVASRMTFTGTASGAQLTAVKTDSTMPSSVADLRTASTGLTPTLVGLMGALPFGGALTAVGAYTSPTDSVILPEEDNWWVFAPGEGFVLWQDTAGTASDTRVMNVMLAWDEIDTA